MRGRKARKEPSETLGEPKPFKGQLCPWQGDKQANSPQKDQILSDQVKRLWWPNPTHPMWLVRSEISSSLSTLVDSCTLLLNFCKHAIFSH